MRRSARRAARAGVGRRRHDQRGRHRRWRSTTCRSASSRPARATAWRRELGVQPAAGSGDRRRAANRRSRPIGSRRDRRPAVRRTSAGDRLRRAHRVRGSATATTVARLCRLRADHRRGRVDDLPCRSIYRITIGGVETASTSRALLVTIANSAAVRQQRASRPARASTTDVLDLVVIEEAIADRGPCASCRGCSTARSSRVRGCTIRRMRRGDDRIRRSR